MCTLEKRDQLYILTITGATEHRLNPTLLTSIRSALHQIRSDYSLTKTSSVLITAAEGKFFSNGFDLAWSNSEPCSQPQRAQLMSSLLQQTISDLLTLPMPTVAAVTGHAAAAGMLLALSHDYIVMREDRGFLYMSEMDIGLVIPDYFMTVIRGKVGEGRKMRELVMKAKKVTAREAVEMGIVDGMAKGEKETVEAAVRLGEEILGRRWDGRVYAENRMVLFKEICRAMEVEGDKRRKVVGSKL